MDCFVCVFPPHVLRDPVSPLYYAAFTQYRNYRNFKMTTRDVLLGAVHVLGLGIMLFYGNTINA